MSIVEEAPGYLQVFSDGSVKRFVPAGIAPASPEPSNGYKSKDVIIDSSKPVTGRLFLPCSDPTTGFSSKLPVVIYFHGGGFCCGSTTWTGYHNFLGDFSAASQSIVLSVDYRLAPEYRLPIAYEDCYSSLDWLGHSVGSEPWLEQADLSRVFLSGESAGGNIVHHVAVKAIQNNTCHVRINGLLVIHPYYGSEKRTEKEMAEGAAAAETVAMSDMFWRLTIPEGSNRDYYGCNFEKAELSGVEWSRFPAVVVFVAGLDFLKERGDMYAEFLQKKGVGAVRLVETEEESHAFHVFHPESEATLLLQRQMSEFIKSS